MAETVIFASFLTVAALAVHNIPARYKSLKKITALILISMALLSPLWIRPEVSAGMRFMHSIVMTTFSMKAYEMLVLDPAADFKFANFPIRIDRFSNYEFLILLLSYPDEESFGQWLSARRDSEDGFKMSLRANRIDGLRLCLGAVKYWAILNGIMAVYPADPAVIYMTQPAFWSWQFWYLTGLTGVGAYAILSFLHSALMGFYSILFGVKMKQIFRQPFRALSFKELWGRRWNVCYRDHFYRIVFSLLHNKQSSVSDKQRHVALKKKNDDFQESGRRMKTRTLSMSFGALNETLLNGNRHKFLGAMLTFLFSGILHEYITYMSFGFQLTFDMILFFVAHGLLTSLETALHLSPSEERLSSMPRFERFIRNSLVVGTCIFLGPLFMKQFILNDFVHVFKLPYVPGTVHSLALC